MIRTLEHDDIPAAAAIWRELRPDAVHSEEGLRHLIESMPERAQTGAWVAVDGGSVVGWGFAHRRWWRASNTANAWLGVLPAARGRGLGSALLRAVEAHAGALDVERLFTNVVDAEGERFAGARGFEATGSDVISAVDPRLVDLGDLPAREARAGRDGYRLATFSDVDAHALYRLDVETSDDMPGGDAPHELSFEEWSAEVLERPDLALDGSFAVVSGGLPVALCALAVDRAGRRGRNDGTGTDREHRGRGLATLVKLASIRWAVANGIERIVTDNEAGNAPMLAVNERLGYRRFLERQRLVKELGEAGTAS